MVSLSTECINKEQYFENRFLWPEGMKTSKTDRLIALQYRYVGRQVYEPEERKTNLRKGECR